MPPKVKTARGLSCPSVARLVSWGLGWTMEAESWLGVAIGPALLGVALSFYCIPRAWRAWRAGKHSVACFLVVPVYGTLAFGTLAILAETPSRLLQVFVMGFGAILFVATLVSVLRERSHRPDGPA